MDARLDDLAEGLEVWLTSILPAPIRPFIADLPAWLTLALAGVATLAAAWSLIELFRRALKMLKVLGQATHDPIGAIVDAVAPAPAARQKDLELVEVQLQAQGELIAKLSGGNTARATISRMTVTRHDFESGYGSKVTITLSNKGNVPITLSKIRCIKFGEATWVNCDQPRYSLDFADWSYNFDIEDHDEIPGIHSVPVGNVATFDVIFGRTHGEPNFTNYRIALEFVFDETEATVRSNEFLIEMSGPAFIKGMYTAPVTKETWCKCQVENIRRFAKIGRDVTDLFDAEAMQEIRRYL